MKALKERYKLTQKSFWFGLVGLVWLIWFGLVGSLIGLIFGLVGLVWFGLV